MKKIFLFLTILFTLSNTLVASESEKKPYNAGEMILGHIVDDHSWHIISIDDKHISVPLPVILYHEGKLEVFLSSRFHHGHSSYKGFKLGTVEDGEGAFGKVLCVDENDKWTGETPLDFSITKNVFSIFVVVFLISFLVIKASRKSKKSVGKAPKGLLTFVEFVILFIRDDIAIPAIGKKRHEKFLPFLLTVFCFIFVSNIMGLIPFFPGGANVTGNIAVTLVLALFTFFFTNFYANKGYWTHIVNMPGVPWWLKIPIPLMPLVEFIGIFTKPFSLMIRLFANITAGHIIILGFMSIIFIFGSQNIAVGYGVSPIPILFSLFMSLIELLVAYIQAYVFTLLSAIYIGMAYEENHHKKEVAEKH